MNQASPPAGTSAVQMIERPAKSASLTQRTGSWPWAAAEPEGMGAGPTRELLCVGGDFGRRTEAVEVFVERGPVVDLDHVIAPQVVTSIGSPMRSQPWLHADPERPVGGDRRGGDAAGDTWSPWIWKVRSIFSASPAQPPTSGTVEPTISCTPRIISCWLPAAPSESSRRARLGRVVEVGDRLRRRPRPPARSWPLSPRPEAV